MHVHGAPNLQAMALLPTQSMQQTFAVRKATADVRRKLTSFAATGGADAVSHVEAYDPESRDRKQGSPRDEESFRDVFVSTQA